ncbi:hypothetical protein [secondary endosymbiont of Trabutina mannipara]|nr:hypothetical protein [secondary endosymbiont of Trabutina mannipara]
MLINRESFIITHDISSYSFVVMAKASRSMLKSSLITFDFYTFDFYRS